VSRACGYEYFASTRLKTHSQFFLILNSFKRAAAFMQLMGNGGVLKKCKEVFRLPARQHVEVPMLRIVAALTLSSLLFSGGGTSGCRRKQSAAPPSETPGRENTMGELKVLAEGFHSSIVNSFIAVVRDAETYDALLKLDSNLPKVDPEFFKTNTIIAAFLGQRNTGGYSVTVSRDAGGRIQINEKVPGKDVMVPQMITSPFKLVSIQSSGAPASLSLGRAFQQRVQTYKVTSASFKISGGLTGRGDEFRLEGEIQTMREADLVTISFALKSAGASRERSLNDYATGLVRNNRLNVNKLSDGGLVDPPSGGLRAKGEFLPDNKLVLKFSGIQIMVPESYTGEGSLEAKMVSASAN
jgi:hypothetical protein